MIISIVIPTLYRDDCVRNCLEDLEKLAGTDFEVILVIQSSCLAPCVGLYSFDLRYFFLNMPNASLARNIGLREARGEIVLFLDDDVRISNPKFLQNHLRHYADKCTPGVIGQVLELNQRPTDQPEPNEIEGDWGWMRLPPNYSRPCRTRDGKSANLSVRKEWAVAVGGMDAWFTKGARREETEFNLRYTKRYGPLLFDPDADLLHLSASGGSRTWGRVTRRVPMHHIVGHWYFLMRVVRDQTLGVRGVILELRYILVALLKNPQIGTSILVAAENLIRALYGAGLAFVHLAVGPRRISNLDPSIYQEVFKSNDA